jgi:chromosome segregation ATPase
VERKTKADFAGRERRDRSRSGRSLPERRLDYWRQLERLGLTVVTEHAEWVPRELLSHHEALEAQITEYETYLDALRKTIEAEETGFRDYENTFLERLERERKKRKQLREKIHRDRPDPADLRRQIGLSEEELHVLERRISEEEAKSTGEVHEALRELRLERIRR